MANLASGLQWAETAVWQFLTNFETRIMRADKWQRVDGLCNSSQYFKTLMAFIEVLFFFFEVVVWTLFQDDFQRNHCSWVNSGWSVSFCMMVIFCWYILLHNQPSMNNDTDLRMWWDLANREHLSWDFYILKQGKKTIDPVKKHLFIATKHNYNL